MRGLCREPQRGFDQFAQPGIFEKRILRMFRCPGQRQHQGEFLVHAAGKIRRPVMPVFAVKAAAGRAERIAVEHLQNPRHAADRLKEIPVPMSRLRLIKHKKRLGHGFLRFWHRAEPLRDGNAPAHAEGARRHFQPRRGLVALRNSG